MNDREHKALASARKRSDCNRSVRQRRLVERHALLEVHAALRDLDKRSARRVILACAALLGDSQLVNAGCALGDS